MFSWGLPRTGKQRKHIKNELRLVVFGLMRVGHLGTSPGIHATHVVGLNPFFERVLVVKLFRQLLLRGRPVRGHHQSVHAKGQHDTETGLVMESHGSWIQPAVFEPLFFKNLSSPLHHARGASG